MHKPCRCAIALLFALTAAGFRISTADDGKDELYSPSRTIVVTAAKAPIMAGEETVQTVFSGTVLRYSKENGPWLMIPRYGGWIKRDVGQPLEKADDFFSRIIRDKPTAEAFHHRGVVRSELGRYADAIADFNEAIQRDGKNSAMFVNRAIAQMRAGHKDEALKDFTSALERDPDNLLALLSRSTLLTQSRQLDAALVDVETMLEIAPDFADALNNRGVIRRLQARYPEALADFTQAIANYPRFPVAFSNRGYVREQLGEFEAALNDYAEARKLDPNFVEPVRNMAWVLATCRDEKFRNPAKAVELAELAQTLAPAPSADGLDILAAAYAAAGRFDDAVSNAEKALELATADDKAAIINRLEAYRRQEPHIEE